MSKKSIFEGVKYIYAEMLKGPVTLTIKKAVGGIEFIDPRGIKTDGFDLYFNETDKVLGVVGVTVRRQVAMACGTDNSDEMVGKRITLYTIKSAKSATGQAIRVQECKETSKAVGGAK